MSLDGKLDYSPIPGNLLPAGAFIGSNFVAPTGGQVFYVRGDGTNATSYSYDPAGLQDRLIASVQKALSYCVAGRGDTVLVLPGHTENLAAANSWSNLVAGVTIKGCGLGNLRPTFTWTTATSTLLLSKANVTLDNLILLCAGPAGTTALTVAAPINISAAGVTIRNCKIEVGIDADQLATDAIVTTAAADDLTIANNEVYGAAAAEITTCFKIVGADRLKFVNNIVRGALATDTDGLLKFVTTLSADVFIVNNYLHANGTGNQTCIDMAANLANTGWLDYNICRNMTDANLNWILTSGSGVDMQLGNNNWGINNSNERGKQIGTASA